MSRKSITSLYAYVVFLSIFLPYVILAQDNDEIQQIKSSLGEIHGNFQVDAQYYRIDSAIGAPNVPEKVRAQGFGNINYTRGHFSAGFRYETYQKALQGFDPRYNGNGIPYRYVNYLNDNLEITIGNYYEQFGSGMIFRAYEERGLGYDNVMDGMRVRIMPYKGVTLKGVFGTQRFFFTQGPGIVRGIDGEVIVNDLTEKLGEMPLKITFGGSWVSKFQKDEDPTYILPQNVAAGAGRVRLQYKKFSFDAEYVYKVNDPQAVNGYIYKPGEALLVSVGYAQKGLGITLSAKRIDDMSFRSDRTATGNNLLINYLPALTRQHTYMLPATIYPYATQPNGEMAFQAECVYKIKKGSKLGGPFGTEILINYSGVNNLDTIALTNGDGYQSEFVKVGKTVYFRDFNVEITRKFSKKFKTTVSYLYFVYNKDIVQGLTGFGTIYANMGVLDMSYKLNDANTIRFESQILDTKQDEGSWATALIEYTRSPNWFFAILDQYNYGNKDVKKRLHYPNFIVGYVKGGNRITLSYGRQRAGIFCVGGVCRNVPAANGLSLSITSTF